MGNHCIYTVCSCCGHEYCVRCDFGICPKCGTPWDANPMDLDEYINENRKGTLKMTIDEIVNAASILCKTDRIRLVNRILASVKSKGDNVQAKESGGIPMPVFEGLNAFCDIYKRAKGVSYTTSRQFTGADYQNMRSLLLKIGDRICEAEGITVTDSMRIDSLKMFLEAVCMMKNQWYFENRFNPYGLNNDFEKIYSNLVNSSDYARIKTAYENL